MKKQGQTKESKNKDRIEKNWEKLINEDKGDFPRKDNVTKLFTQEGTGSFVSGGPGEPPPPPPSKCDKTLYTGL